MRYAIAPRRTPHRDEALAHGASPTNAMAHIAIQESLDSKNVEWMEKVTDDEYRAGVSAAKED